MKKNKIVLFTTIIFALLVYGGAKSKTKIHFLGFNSKTAKSKLSDKILSGDVSLTPSELMEFKDDSKISVVYLELFEDVVELTPNLDELKFLAASALVDHETNLRKNNLRNLLLQLSYMDKIQLSKLDQDYKHLLVALINQHFPEIITDLKKENPNSQVFNFLNNYKEQI